MTPRPAHTAAYVAVWGSGFLILRVFAVSGYDWATAFAVSTTLSLQDGVTLLFGSLMAGHLVTALLLMGVLPLLIVAGLWGPEDHRPTLMLLAALGLVMLVALSTSFHSWWLPPATVVVLGALALAHRQPPERRLRRAVTAAMAHAGRLAGVGVLLVAALVQTPWVPHEKIRTTDGIINGYVLSVDSGYLNVLTDRHRFLIVLTSDVLSRD